MRYRFLRTRLGREMRWSRTEASNERGPSSGVSGAIEADRSTFNEVT